jgi:hypothetical protein
MIERTTLLGGAAVCAMLAVSMGATAHADTTAPKKLHHVVKAAPKVDHAAEVQAELNQLREQVEALKAWHDAEAAKEADAQAQLAQVKTQLAEAQAQAQAAQAKVDAQIETIPGVVKKEIATEVPQDGKLHYKGITVTPGGFLAMETLYRSHAEGADIGSSFSGIPLPATATSHSGETRFSARQSRLTLLAEGDVGSAIHLTGYYEMDFLGAAQTANSNESNSFNPRMRVVYSTVDWKQAFGDVQLLAGQSWSLAAMNTKGTAARSEDVPPTIDAQYSVGFVWARQPQIRLTANLGDMFSFAASVENPTTSGVIAPTGYLPGVTAPIYNMTAGSLFNSANSVSLNKYPDVIGKAAFDKDIDGHAFHAEAFGILRDFYAQVTSLGVPGGEDTTGGGAGGGMILSVVPKLFDVQVSGLVGRGIGRYASGSLPDVSYGLNGAIHPIREYDLLAGGTFHYGKSLDIYVLGGEEREYGQDYVGLNGATTIYGGVGNPNYNNTGCEVYGGACSGQTHYLEQLTAGFWDRVYNGKFGKFQFGVQYSYTERHIFTGDGVTGIVAGGNPSPVARENIIMTSIRYYPF